MLKAPGPLACGSMLSHPNHPNYSHLGFRVHPPPSSRGSFLLFTEKEQGGACQALWSLSVARRLLGAFTESNGGVPKTVNCNTEKLHPGTCWNSGLHAALRAAKRQGVAGASAGPASNHGIKTKQKNGRG